MIKLWLVVVMAAMAAENRVVVRDLNPPAEAIDLTVGYMRAKKLGDLLLDARELAGLQSWPQPLRMRPRLMRILADVATILLGAYNPGNRAFVRRTGGWSGSFKPVRKLRMPLATSPMLPGC